MSNPTRFPRLVAAIIALGSTDDERAQKLNVSRRTITNIKRGIIPKQLDRIAMHRDLAEAYCQDAAALHIVEVEA
jgi:DNA-binding XRE family transcriptional regulator